MARCTRTGGVALGAMVLGVTTVTGFTPAQYGGAVPPADAVRYAREVRAAAAAGALSPDTGERTTTGAAAASAKK
ncbi:hypothetical protein [Streptomyces exfoliatus]|uniref:hypothetical protein n=1 Tax=Streptomyces exfoliatus TaxID=1905 RepID=UPI003C2B0B7E